MTSSVVFNKEVSSIQKSFNTLKYYTGTQNGVLITEVSTFQRLVIERFHCTRYITILHRKVSSVYTVQSSHVCQIFSRQYPYNCARSRNLIGVFSVMSVM